MSRTSSPNTGSHTLALRQSWASGRQILWGSGRIRWISPYGVPPQVAESHGVTTLTLTGLLPDPYSGFTRITRCAGSSTSCRYLFPRIKPGTLSRTPMTCRAYERLCREFGVDPSTDWRQKDSNSGGLGTVYQYNHGYQPKGSWNRNRMRFQPDSSLSANSSLWSREHIDYIAQGPEADEAWSSFILDKSQGFTAPGVERLNDSIRTYVWAILGAQAQTRSAILGAGTSFDAQKQFLANVEDAISSPVDIPSAIERYQSVLQNASSKVDYAFGTGLYMAPSDMRLHIGTAIAGYNNNIVIAPVGQPLGVSPDINSTSVPAPVETGETGLVVPQTHNTSSVTTMTHSVAPPMTHSVVPFVPREQTQKAQDHEDKKTALVAAGVVLGLVSLWLMRR